MEGLTRRGFLFGSSAVVLSLALPAIRLYAAPVSAGPADPTLIEDLVLANRILADLQVLDGYGHVSARHDKSPDRYLLARSMAPELVTAADIMEYDLDSNAVDPRGRHGYLERFIHGEIYKVRPDVKAIVHSHSPEVIPFGVSSKPMRAISTMGGFIVDPAPVYDIAKYIPHTDMLVTSPKAGQALAQVLGNHPVVLMRGHGMAVVGDSLKQVVFRSYYTQMNAQLQARAMALGGDVHYLSHEEAENIAKTANSTIDRPWQLWRKKIMGK